MKPKTKTQKSKTKSLTKLQTTIMHNEALEEQLARVQEHVAYLNKEFKNLCIRLEEKSMEIAQLKEQNSNLVEAISVLGRNIRLQNQGERFKEESHNYTVMESSSRKEE